MAGYVALLRGIGPGNPNMRNEHLRRVFRELGFDSPRTVISSGNVVFDSDSDDIATMEAALEAAWPDRLGFSSTTIIQARSQIQQLVDADPYRGLAHGRESYLLVTFFKRPPPTDAPLPVPPRDEPYRLLGLAAGALCSVTDTTVAKTPDLMSWLEREYGQQISSRTWNTVRRIQAKMR